VYAESFSAVCIFIIKQAHMVIDDKSLENIGYIIGKLN
jgi:hypothetical protein